MPKQEIQKTKIQIACERYGIDPRSLGDTHNYRFPLAAILAGATSAQLPLKIQNTCLLVSLTGQPNTGLAADYAGLELEFTVDGRDFASDGVAAQKVPFAMLFGRLSHPEWEWEVPPLIQASKSITARVLNNTAGTLTPSVVCKVVEIRK